jgi:hypothetical protein
MNASLRRDSAQDRQFKCFLNENDESTTKMHKLGYIFPFALFLYFSRISDNFSKVS